ncbi:MAG: hypothetical protein M0C28_04900 [Candidatus Moduliflexus flocculans]|nr:hypothetical protein [Candidatus Moduliflexus flocculans]
MIPIDKIAPESPSRPAATSGNIQELAGLDPEQGRPRAHLRPRQGAAGSRSSPASAGISPPRTSASRTCPAIDMDRRGQPRPWRSPSSRTSSARTWTSSRRPTDCRRWPRSTSYNHEQISSKLGKARSTVTEIPGDRPYPEVTRQGPHPQGGRRVPAARPSSRSPSSRPKTTMVKLTRDIIDRRLTREDTRDLAMKYLKGKTKKVKYYVYNFVPDRQRTSSGCGSNSRSRRSPSRRSSPSLQEITSTRFGRRTKRSDLKD